MINDDALVECRWQEGGWDNATMMTTKTMTMVACLGGGGGVAGVEQRVCLNVAGQ